MKKVKEKEKEKEDSPDEKPKGKKKKKLSKKAIIIIVAIIVIAVIIIYAGWAMTGGASYPTVSEVIKDKSKYIDDQVEVKGTVKEDTIDTVNKTFVITDDKNDLRINYTGVLPSNLVEGTDVVVKGILRETDILFIESEEITVGCASKY
jgi:cytochrome c-type biogenesis protein CcmE